MNLYDVSLILYQYTQRYIITKLNKNEPKFYHRTIVKWDYSCFKLKISINTLKDCEISFSLLSSLWVIQRKKYNIYESIG